jgi:hypothetical protein
MHHEELTRALKAAGINMSYTPDEAERFMRAREAGYVYLWMLSKYEK